uniref:HKT1 n=1 Tax=Arundo donax TaxID=35708 RepID=A0A0A8YDZ7_ARUDO
MTRANSTNIGGERVEMSITASPACLVFTLWNSEHTSFWNQFNPSKGFESHPK